MYARAQHSVEYCRPVSGWFPNLAAASRSHPGMGSLPRCRVWAFDASPTGERTIWPGPAFSYSTCACACACACTCAPLRSSFPPTRGAAIADHQRPDLTTGSCSGSGSRLRGPVQLHGQASQCGQASPTLLHYTAPHTVTYLTCSVAPDAYPCLGLRHKPSRFRQSGCLER